MAQPVVALRGVLCATALAAGLAGCGGLGPRSEPLNQPIAGSAEALSAVVAGQVPVGTYLVWLTAATLGNTVGGVIIVSLLNYGQVMGSRRDPRQGERPLSDIEAETTSGTAAYLLPRRELDGTDL